MPGERALGRHWIGDGMGSRAGLDVYGILPINRPVFLKEDKVLF
jgi:hypothetical protein